MNVTMKKTAIEKKMAQLERELKSIESSAAFRKEKSLRRALTNLMKKHQCSAPDLIALLQDFDLKNASGQKEVGVKTRKPRKLKIYKNPETGEIVKTRGGNHRVLKAWKAQYKLEDINEWSIA